MHVHHAFVGPIVYVKWLALKSDQEWCHQAQPSGVYRTKLVFSCFQAVSKTCANLPTSCSKFTYATVTMLHGWHETWLCPAFWKQREEHTCRHHNGHILIYLWHWSHGLSRISTTNHFHIWPDIFGSPRLINMTGKTSAFKWWII